MISRAAYAIFFSTVFPLWADAGSLTALHDFGSGTDGSYPATSVVEHDGALVGITAGGGVNGLGTVFSFDLTTHKETILHSFATGEITFPVIDLAYNEYGIFVTTMFGGGGYNLGSVVRIDVSTGNVTTIESFTGANGAYPTHIILDGDTLYGITQEGGSQNNYGTIYKIDLQDYAETVLYSFAGFGGNGGFPSGLALYGGLLYGSSDSTLFAFDLKTEEIKLLYTFQGKPDGVTPSGVSYHNGFLYGTTLIGGTDNLGTVYKFDLASNTETILYDFAGGDSGSSPLTPPIAYGNNLVGVTDGLVYRINLKSSKEKSAYRFVNSSLEADGAPNGPLTRWHDALYGTTNQGGMNNKGMLFKLTR